MFDACDWRDVKTDRTGTVTIDSNRYLAGPKWHSMCLMAGVRALRVGLALGFAFTATGFVVYGFASTLPVFLAGGVITGLGYGLGGMVGVTMLIRRWYASGFSGAIGLASVGSGVASVVVPICAVHLIEGLSLSISFRIQAFVALVIGVIVFLAMRNRPADMGVKPFERDDGTGTAKRGMSGAGRNVSPRTRKLLLVAVSLPVAQIARAGATALQPG